MAPSAKRRRRRSCSRKKATHAAPEGGPDLITDLPNELLGAIISLLPTDDGIRTRTISRRWKPLWLSAWLNLDDGDLRPWRNGDDLVELITRILSTHPGPARRLSITNLARVSSTHGDDRYATFDSWFRSPVLDRIQELNFRYLYKYRIGELDPLPAAALRFTDLRTANYGRCHFPENLEGVSFPNLSELTLYELTNSEATLDAMIKACPSLKSLLLMDNKGFRRVSVSSKSLVCLGLSVGKQESVMEELTILDAPSMERLLFFNTDLGPISVRVIGAPNLQVLGCLSSYMLNVHLGTTVLQEMIAITAITSMHAVKILSLGADGFELDKVIDILKCFPCLEKLYFTSMVEGSGKTMLDDHGVVSIDCLDTHLKEIVLKNYRSTRAHVMFAKFFILNAGVLKLMKFRVPIERTKNWEANQRRKLPKQTDRASRAARFEFVFDTYFFRNYEHTYRTHELLECDPFDG